MAQETHACLIIHAPLLYPCALHAMHPSPASQAARLIKPNLVSSPVMKEAAGEARNAMTRATSSGCPMRPRACISASVATPLSLTSAGEGAVPAEAGFALPLPAAAAAAAEASSFRAVWPMRSAKLSAGHSGVMRGKRGSGRCKFRVSMPGASVFPCELGHVSGCDHQLPADQSALDLAAGKPALGYAISAAYRWQVSGSQRAQPQGSARPGGHTCGPCCASSACTRQAVYSRPGLNLLLSRFVQTVCMRANIQYTLLCHACLCLALQHKHVHTELGLSILVWFNCQQN